MRKNLLAIICFLLLFSVIGCTSPAPDTQNPTSEISSDSVTTHASETTEPSPVLFDFTTSLYKTGEDVSVFSAESSTAYDSRTYTDTSVPKARTMDIFGTTYELTYVNSAAFALTGQEIHVYQLQGTEYGKVFIDVQTDTVVKYMSIPYTPTEKNEENYQQTVRKLVGNTVDLSEYEYSCATWYMAVYDNGVESNETSGFRVCEENESLRSYTFGYNKYIDKYRSVEHVTAIFDFDTESITLEIIDFEYDNNLIANLLDCWNAYQLEVDNYFTSIVQQGYSIQKIEATDHTFFMRDGILHVVTTAELTFENNGASFGTLAQAVTACIPKSE